MATSDEAVYAAPDAHVYADTTATRSGWLTGGGTTGNERLTSTVGATLLVLLAALGVTILRIGGLLAEHCSSGCCWSRRCC